ncbi:MAG: TlpA disulfide reductase family protein [Oceanococcaceae bacterium]
MKIETRASSVGDFRALIIGLVWLLATAQAGAAPASGRVLSLAEYRADPGRGDVVYLDFWASWCAPCKLSFPFMSELHERYAAQGLRIVAVSLDSRESDARRFLQQVPAPFDVVLDPQAELTAEYDVPAMPTSYLLDRQGRVLERHEGFRAGDREAIEAAIQMAIGGAASAPASGRPE